MMDWKKPLATGLLKTAARIVAEWLAPGSTLATTIGAELAGEAIGALAKRDAERLKQPRRQLEKMVRQIAASVEAALKAERVEGLSGGALPGRDEALAVLAEHASAALFAKYDLELDRIVRDLAGRLPKELEPRGRRFGELIVRETVRAMLGMRDKLEGLQFATQQELLTRSSELARKLGDTERTVEEIGRTSDRIETVTAATDRRVQQLANTHHEAANAAMAEAEDFESFYREAVADKYDHMELFGVGLPQDSPFRRQSLTAAYISLNVDSEDEDSGGPKSFEEMLNEMGAGKLQCLLLRGDAGSGKSTLLKWAAIDGATSRGHGIKLVGGNVVRFFRLERKLEFDAASKSQFDAAFSRARPVPANVSWPERVPFLIVLRDCVDGKMPAPAELTLSVSETRRPPDDGWAESILKSGRALLLIDGIDEVPQQHRERVFSQIDDYIRSWRGSGNWFVLSTRPLVEDPVWLKDLGFVQARIAPMSDVEQGQLIADWHRAVADKLRDEGKPAKADDVLASVDKVGRQLEQNPSVKQLARSPLLCAMICALSGAYGYQLPDNQAAIVEKLCEMLLYQREREWLGQRLEQFPKAYRQLSYKQRKKLVGRIARHMIVRNVPILPVSEARQQVAERLPGMGLAASDAEAVMNALLERGGLVRRTSEREAPASHTRRDDGQCSMYVDFLHGTFKEYLAAQEFVDDNELETVLAEPLREDCTNVCLFAVSLGNKSQASRLVRTVLDKRPAVPRKRGGWQSNANRRAFREHAELSLLAVRMNAFKIELEPDLPAQLRALEEGLFPPRTLGDAQVLALLGEEVVPQLRPKPEFDVSQRAACVRALVLIGGSKAGQVLREYVPLADDMKLAAELARGLDPLSIPLIRKRVTTEPPGDTESDDWLPASVRSQIASARALSDAVECTWLDLSVTGIRDLTPLALMTQLQMLVLHLTGVSDLTPLAGLTQLRWLDLEQTAVSELAPLAGMTQLRTLDLTDTGVSDLTPLAGLTQLRRLFLDRTRVSDLRPLAGLTRLKCLALADTDVSDLAPLAGLAQLQSLNLSDTEVSGVRPLAALKRLEWIALIATCVSELGPLAGLTRLRELYLSFADVSDLTPLAGLTRLETLWLSNTGVRDLTPLAGLTQLETLSLDQTRVSDLTPLAGLTQLEHLVLSDTDVSDLTPLKGLKAIIQVSSAERIRIPRVLRRRVERL